MATSVPENLIEDFCNVTGAAHAEAKIMLEACNNNLEMAVNMHMEGQQPPDANAISDDDDVRAPIPQKQEVLIEAPENMTYNFRGRRRPNKSVFDKFRDFEAETNRQEEELSSVIMEGPSSSNRSNKRQKKRTLEELFRPPIDLMFKGTFQAAKDAGVSEKKWLLVNVQDSTEFPCQVLNRDVWSNAAVRTIIKEHFIFWQIYYDSEEGQKYMNFYRVNEWPYVAVIDSRTGECLVTWHKLDVMTFCDLVTEFLCKNSLLNDSSGDDLSPIKKKSKANDSIIEADEASQIEAAIKASLEEPRKNSKIQNNGTPEETSDLDTDLETFESEDEDVDYSIKKSNPKSTKSITKYVNSANKNFTNGNCTIGENPVANESPTDSWESYLGPEHDPKSEIMLRLPDGSKDLIKFPCSSRLMALVKYVESKGFSNESYELVTNFPRKKLSYMDFDTTLKEAGLFPKEAVFIQGR